MKKLVGIMWLCLCVTTHAQFRIISCPPASGGGNATVPVDAPIQPPQAFVDSFAQLSLLSNVGGHQITLASQGITSVTPSYLSVAYDGTWDNATVDLSGNALTVANVNAILAAFAGGGGSGTLLDLSGGTSAAPTGQGLTDKATLIGVGWTVTTN